MMIAPHPAFQCVSWNIHRCKGNDGVLDPARTLSVLRDEVWQPGAHALVLQEADTECPPHAGLLDIAAVEQATGLRCLHVTQDHRWGPQSHGFLGVIMFVHPAITCEQITLLDLPGHCHRGAVVADLSWDGVPFRLIGTHLSLWQGLRMAQLRIIGQHVFRQASMPSILVGDLNEWRPWGGLALSPKIMGVPFHGPACSTFPINRPFLPLDRVLATAPAQVNTARVLDGAGIRMASDHRPLVADITLQT